MSKIRAAQNILKELGFRGFIYAIGNKLQGKPTLFGIIKEHNADTGQTKTIKLNTKSKTNKDYLETTPSVQNVLDIFKGQWSCKVPIENTVSGPGDFFNNDERISNWNSIYPVKDKSILELGPLEGAHTYQLEQLGAASITSIEASRTSYLKCLIVKDLLNMNVELLHGDFREYLKTCDKKYDIVLASGVLYHMTDPISLLQDIAKITDNLFLSTHYFSKKREDKSALFDPNPIILSGNYKGYKHYYVNTDDADLILGGTKNFSIWMEKDDILSVLNNVGFNNIVLLSDNTKNPLGNIMAVYAGK